MTSGRAYLAGLAVGLVFVALAGGLNVPPLATHGDFAEQWTAARIVLNGGDPYDATTWRADAARLAGRASDAAAFVYPPYVTLALTPFALLPLPVAATVWIVLSVMAAAIALRRLLQEYPAHPLAAFGYGLALLASGPAVLALAQGQWDFLLLASVCYAGVGALRSGPSIAAASLLVAKPQIAPFALIGLARSCDDATRRRLGIALGIVLTAIVLTAIRLDWWGEWLRGAFGFQAARPIRTTTIGTLLEPLGLVGAALVLVLIALAVTIAWRARGPAALAPWLAASVLLAPYVQAYDHLLLVPPVAIATARARSGAFLAVIAILVLIAGEFAVAAVTLDTGRDVVGALVPLTIWALVILAAKRS